MKKLRVAVLCGGKSAEHEVSIESAKNIIQALDPKKYEVHVIGIDKKGRWLPVKPSILVASREPYKALPRPKEAALVTESPEEAVGPVDVVFPVLHGPLGEDGSMQGLLKIMNVPFVGAGVLGSAVGMDKDVTKRLLRAAGIPVASFMTVHRTEARAVSYRSARNMLGQVLFIKPANLGSSVGVSKVRNEREFKRALREAFRYDEKILIEGEVKGREVECSVLGNERPIASTLGEIKCRHEFYSYDAKYLDPNGADLIVPAKVPKQILKEAKALAIRTFKALSLEGMARVDFFLTARGKLIVNEVNTIPGFTKISMYPKLWEASGIGYSELVDRLINLALERFRREQRLRTSR